MALSLRARLIGWYSALLLVALASFIAVVLWVHWRLLLHQYDEGLEALSRLASNAVAEEMGERSNLALAAEEAEEIVRTPDYLVKILDRNGRPLVADTIKLPLEVGNPALSTPGTRTVSSTSNGLWRMQVRAGHVEPEQYFVLVGAPLREVAEQWWRLVQASAIGLPVVLLISGVGGWWVARYALMPLTDMTAQAREITARTTDSRLPVPASRDELSQLAVSFNHVLERLTAALADQRRFMADASHELRTPVSVIRTAADVTLSRPERSAEEYKEAVEAMGQQGERLARLVDDMLIMARGDAGGYPIVLAPVDLGALAYDSVRDLTPLASDRQITIDCQAPADALVPGDEMLLRRVIMNLLHNAIVYTPPGGHVNVSVSGAGDVIELRVRDSGPGIPEADRARVFERFVRLDPARAGGGAGLGLAIARWIAELHGGTLSLATSGPSGTTFALSLRRAADA